MILPSSVYHHCKHMLLVMYTGTDDDSSKSVDSPPDPAGEDSETNTQ